MTSRVLLTAALWLMWVALWGDFSAGTVVAGLLAAVGVMVTVPVPSSDRRWVFRPLGVARFVATFLVHLVGSTWAMVRLVLSPRARSATGVVIAVRLSPASYPVRTLVAHAISLTPGTLTVDVEDDGRTLRVHVIDADDVPGARRAIRQLDDRACQAFAPNPTTTEPASPQRSG